ncbi:MAG: cytochrome c maturation protein CcmE [Pseudomonadota bacterium]|nr:cytochrome c maturation protein CcmE [Pseudomonadota bacterium]
MAMTRKKRRIVLIGIGAAFLASASLLVGVGMRDSIVFFLSPTEIAERAPGPEQRLRVGGLVVEGSIAPVDGGGVRFALTDGAAEQAVEFAGILPDLFAEGQGAIAEGRMVDGLFVASEVLAKHDEKYMPREVEAALKEQGVYRAPTEDGEGRAVAPGTGG